MVSGRAGQAGLVARSRAVAEFDVELDAVTAVDGASAQTPIPRRAFWDTVVSHVTSLSLFDTYNVIYVVSLKRTF